MTSKRVATREVGEAKRERIGSKPPRVLLSPVACLPLPLLASGANSPQPSSLLYGILRRSMRASWILRMVARRSPERFVFFVFRYHVVSSLLSRKSRRPVFLLQLNFLSRGPSWALFSMGKSTLSSQNKSCKIVQNSCKIVHSSSCPILQNRSQQPNNKLRYNNLVVTHRTPLGTSERAPLL